MTIEKVRGHSNLLRDSRSKAVMNNDRIALQKAKQLKANKLAEIEKSNELEERVKYLECVIGKLLNT